MVDSSRHGALLNKLRILELACSGKKFTQISSQANQSVAFMESTIRNRDGIVKFSTPKAKTSMPSSGKW